MRCIVILVLMAASAAALAHGRADDPGDATDRVISFPDTDKYQTLIVDLHTHSVFSDGHVWPRTRVGEALRDGLDALAITEHLEWQPHLDVIPNQDRNRAYHEAIGAAEDHDIIIIPGSEITREAPAGHMNAVFIEDANALFQDDAGIDPADAEAYYIKANEWPAQQAVQLANDQGAFVFWNHPYWTEQNPDGIARIPDFHKKNARAGLLHGIEIANGNTYSEEAFAIALEHDLVLIGVSDVHNLIAWDYEPYNGGYRPVTLVFAEERSVESIRAALFDKRTVVWFKNLLLGRKQQLMPLLEASLEVTGAEYAGKTHVLGVTIRNRSDARYLLKNTTKYTFMETNDLVVVPPNDEITVHVKPGKRLDRVRLSFDVMNALRAPGKYADISFTVTPTESTGD